MKKYLVFFLVCFTIAASIPAICFAKSDGNKLVSFEATAMSGETINLDNISKNQPVMLFFWASW